MTTPPTPEELGERPAYPVSEHEPGMTTRQAYKMAALKGLLASGILTLKTRDVPVGKLCDDIVAAATEFADAMIAEDAARLKRKEPAP